MYSNKVSTQAQYCDFLKTKVCIYHIVRNSIIKGASVFYVASSSSMCKTTTNSTQNLQNIDEKHHKFLYKNVWFSQIMRKISVHKRGVWVFLKFLLFMFLHRLKKNGALKTDIHFLKDRHHKCQAINHHFRFLLFYFLLQR